MNPQHKRASNAPALLLTTLFTGIVLTGCAAVGPDYTTPQAADNPGWHTKLERGLTADQISPQTLSQWWTTFGDPQLSSLIERAVAGNLDLQDAWARVCQARANRRIAGADMFPTLDLSASDTWTRTSEDTGTGKTNQLFSSSFDSGWEIDLFGGVRRSIEAAEASLQATHEDLRDVLVTLVAEVALNYVEVRTYQTRLAAVQENLEAQTETYQLTQWMCDAGLTDELAVEQAHYNLESTRSQIPVLHTGLEEAMNRIAVLLGQHPGKVHQELSQSRPIPVTSPEIAVGMPADMMRRRPDIRRAERDLAAQTARVGVATADLYPKLTLSGSIEVSAVSFNRLANNASSSGDWTLSGGPKIGWAVFDAGAIRQNIEVQSALQEQALIQYEAVILAALEEVENALVAYADEQYKNDNLREASQAAQRAVELAQQQYQAGLTDFSDVLDAQRSLLSFQDQLAQSDGTVTSNLVRLYKALGGGWTPFAPEENADLPAGEQNEE
ncbi:MAG: efflux transporter outer membrane subunit [Phycisphaerae bacterium]|nr:efflux transporter outer membrane subunit [Phycisphaerae bacterium]